MPSGVDYSRFDKIDLSDSDEGEKDKAVETKDVLSELPTDLSSELSLVLAAKQGQVNLVEALLDSRASPDSADPHGNTALLRAIEGGIANRPVIELLLRRRAAVDKVNKLDETPIGFAAASSTSEVCEALLQTGSPSEEALGMALVCAAAAGNAATMRTLLQGGAPAATSGGDGRSASHCWAEVDDVPLLESLLAARADIDVCDMNGKTPLVCAAQKGSAAAVKFLCACDVDVNVVTIDGRSALVFAAELKDEACAMDVAGALLERRANLEATTSVARAPSPLVVAASAGHRSLVALLLEARAEPNAADGAGRRALPCATATGYIELCQILLEGQADVEGRSLSGKPNAPGDENGKDGGGVTALSIAAAIDRPRLVELLVGAGADHEVSDERGLSPLMAAAKAGGAETCALLIAARAAVSAREKAGGKTVLLFAASSGHRHVCEMLLAARADVHECARTGVAALHAAAANGHSEVCRSLLAAGAAAGAEVPGGQCAASLAAAAGHTEVVELLRAANTDSSVSASG